MKNNTFDKENFDKRWNVAIGLNLMSDERVIAMQQLSKELKDAGLLRVCLPNRDDVYYVKSIKELHRLTDIPYQYLLNYAMY